MKKTIVLLLLMFIITSCSKKDETEDVNYGAQKSSNELNIGGSGIPTSQEVKR